MPNYLTVVEFVSKLSYPKSVWGTVQNARVVLNENISALLLEKLSKQKSKNKVNLGKKVFCAGIT